MGGSILTWFLPTGSWRCGELTRAGFWAWEAAVWVGGDISILCSKVADGGATRHFSSEGKGQNNIMVVW
jgi:hypothetical protein